eukprot:gb/GECG01000382.1/.p1 GENE.gb/GECG01000382.1/~~gb/GECG01000382.1/.p1  ORF type:complete len:136 (+),score=11.84 gb/GECG01000382.1/:1-408(+)
MSSTCRIASTTVSSSISASGSALHHSADISAATNGHSRKPTVNSSDVARSSWLLIRETEIARSGKEMVMLPEYTLRCWEFLSRTSDSSRLVLVLSKASFFVQKVKLQDGVQSLASFPRVGGLCKNPQCSEAEIHS